MSGPKIDKAELERLKQAELERQRIERLRKIQLATKQLNSVFELIRKHLAEINTQHNRLINDAGHNEEMLQAVNGIKEHFNEYRQLMTTLLNKSVPTEAEEIILCAAEVSSAEKIAYEKYISDTTSLYSRVESYLSSQKQLDSLLSNTFSSQKTQDNIPIEDFDFRKCVDSIKNIISDEESKSLKIDQLFDRIENLINSDSLSDEKRRELYHLAIKLQKNAELGSGSFKAIVAESTIVLDQMELDAKAFEDMYLQYYAEYVSFLEIVNRNLSSKFSIVPKERYSFATLLDLQEERDVIRKLSISANEQSYIRAQIDEVMKEVGYNVTDEINFGENRVGSHFICKSKSADTAIHIHLSESNQIMMEIVSAETQPQTDDTSVTGKMVNYKELSEEQCESLLEEQGRFCYLHPQIVEKLKERGVILDAKTHKKPAVEYCKTIVKLDADDFFQNIQYMDRYGAIINQPTGDEHNNVKNKLQERAIKG